MSIYEDLIIDHYKNPRNNKLLKKTTSKVDVENPLCGDSLHFEILEKDGKVEDIGFSGEGCAISIASASILSEKAKGQSIQKLRSMKAEDVVGLLGIELTPNRMKCALLSWEALQKVVKNL